MRTSRKFEFMSVVGLVAMIAGLALVLVPSASAAPPDSEGIHKETICHRTNSVTNPYVVETVDFDSVSGAVLLDKGNGDHTIHLGPVFDSNTVYPPPHNGDQWGDIIPSYTYENGSYPGLNWPAGQAILANGCKPTVTTTTRTQDTTTTTTIPVTTTTVVVTTTTVPVTTTTVPVTTTQVEATTTVPPTTVAVAGDEVTVPPTTQPVTEVVEVLGDEVTATLPVTGAGSRSLTGAGIALLGLGAMLTGVSRRQLTMS